MSKLLSENYTRLYKALSHSLRQDILGLLCRKRLNVSELCQKLHRRQANISQHLQVLKQNELVEFEKIGKRRVYTVKPHCKKIIVYLTKFQI